MLRNAAVSFLIALFAAAFSFLGGASGMAEIAKVLFYMFIVIAAVSGMVGFFSKRQK